MVKLTGVPVQSTPPLLKVGVTVMVATTGNGVAFLAVKAAIFPVPLTPNPICGVLLVQLYTVPDAAPLNTTGAVDAPLHTVWLAGWLTVGVGFTVIVNVTGAPAQPAADGVTVIVAVCTVPVVLVAVKLAILPVPAAASPIVALLLVQLNTVPATAPVKVTAVVADPLHNTWLATVFTVGVGFTVIVNVTGAPVQLTPPLVYVGVTVMVAVTEVLPLLMAVKAAMFPAPVALRPMLLLLLVQL